MIVWLSRIILRVFYGDALHSNLAEGGRLFHHRFDRTNGMVVNTLGTLNLSNPGFRIATQL